MTFTNDVQKSLKTKIIFKKTIDFGLSEFIVLIDNRYLGSTQIEIV